MTALAGDGAEVSGQQRLCRFGQDSAGPLTATAPVSYSTGRFSDTLGRGEGYGPILRLLSPRCGTCGVFQRTGTRVRQGHLPSAAEHHAFLDEIKSVREIPPAVADLLPAIARAGATFIPLDALRTAVSLLTYASDFRPSLDVDAVTLRANLRLAKFAPANLSDIAFVWHRRAQQRAWTTSRRRPENSP